MGKASFAELQDHEGSLQIYLNRDELCPGEDKSMYNDVFKKLLDRGDFIGISGETFTTQTGEQSVMVKELTVLSKSLKPLPAVKVDEDGNVHDAFADPELRYRMRYVDLVVNPDVKATFEARSKVMQTIRQSFDGAGWLEVDTPVLQAIPGGAAARPRSQVLLLRRQAQRLAERAARLDGAVEVARNGAVQIPVRGRVLVGSCGRRVVVDVLVVLELLDKLG